MARTLTIIEVREPVIIRTEILKSGKQGIYLDYKINGKRIKKRLGLYLSGANTPKAKREDSETMRQAEAIRDKYVSDIQSGKMKAPTADDHKKMLLVDLMKHFGEVKLKYGQSATFSLNVGYATKHLIKYKGRGVMLGDISKEYCLGFSDYLRTKATKSNGEHISDKTCQLYFTCLNCALNYAVKEGYLASNPIKMMHSFQRIKPAESTREYLTHDEVQLLIDTPCGNDMVKRAFLFACFCGLRISDIKRLTWRMIEKDGKMYRVPVVMKKTEKAIYVPLGEEAMLWLPEKYGTSPSDLVFTLPTMTSVERILKSWASRAGISKNVSFHVSRHTFATLLVSNGESLAVVRDLMGHKNIATTMIYAKVLDEEKDKAVNTLSSIFKRK